MIVLFLHSDSCKTLKRPTMRAADLGYAPRYVGICLAGSVFRFGGESTLPPQAANANRWALEEVENKSAKQKNETIEMAVGSACDCWWDHIILRFKYAS
jgi:hypothetical protein